jgi:hypothetical protein
LWGWSSVAAREHHAVYVRVRRERRALLGVALHQREHAGRKAGRVHTLGVQLAHERGELARLHDHAVPGGEQRNHVAVGEVEREIERRQHHAHAERTEVVALRAPPGLTRCDQGHALAERDVDLGKRRGHLGLGLPQGLARLAYDGAGELDLARGERGLEPQEGLRTLTPQGRLLAPRGGVEGAPRPAHRLVDGRAPHGHLRQHVFPVTRAHARDDRIGVGLARSDEAAPQIVAQRARPHARCHTA